MRCAYHVDYEIPLPEGHPFPMRKFSALRRILEDEAILSEGEHDKLYKIIKETPNCELP